MAKFFTLVLTAAVSLSATTNPHSVHPQAIATTAQLRQALGGEAALTAVARLHIVGKVKQNVGDGSFELWASLPDRFVQEVITKVSVPAKPPRQSPTTDDMKRAADARASVGNNTAAPGFYQDDDATAARPSIRGFDRGEPLPGSYRTNWKTTYPNVAKLQLDAGYLAFRRIVIPLLAGDHAAHVTGSTPTGLTLVDTDGGQWELTVDETHRPLTLKWSAPYPANAAPPLETFISTFSDYRPVTGGLVWPHRIITTKAGEPFEDLAIKRYEINGKVSNIYFKK